MDIDGLPPGLNNLASPISTLLANVAKNDLSKMVAPNIQATLDRVMKKNVPSDLTVLLAG
jgi:hypothetical protein